ncbi:DUT nucleotidohydrolase, partial [Polyodon spathula]|nr:DUT nucleotidohydrolase [Polyodon spathula]
YSAYDYLVPPGSQSLVLTDIQIKVPPGCYARFAPRSSLAVKHGICIEAGVVDANYTGNVGILVQNTGAEPFEIRAGDRVAQLVCERICHPQVKEVSGLPSMDRGARGYGFSGTKA